MRGILSTIKKTVELKLDPTSPHRNVSFDNTFGRCKIFVLVIWKTSGVQLKLFGCSPKSSHVSYFQEFTNHFSRHDRSAMFEIWKTIYQGIPGQHTILFKAKKQLVAGQVSFFFISQTKSQRILGQLLSEINKSFIRVFQLSMSVPFKEK